jgi:hypothetical protein
MIQLDETGAQYVQLPPHPYFGKPQPEYQKPYYQTGGIALDYGETHSSVRTQSTFTDANVMGKQQLWPYLDF